MVISMGNGNIVDFKSPSCSEPVCACTHLGVVFKPTDPDLTVYRFDKSTPPATCAGQGNFGKVKCVQSGNTFTPTGDVNTSVYKFTRCEDPPGGGNSSENIGAGSGGGSGGGVGNDVGEGEGFRPRSKPPNSRGCDVNSYPFVCSGGSMNFEMQLNGACMVPPLEGPPVLPTDINDITRRVQGDTYIAAYSRKTVACADSCSKYIGYLECGRNGWVNMDKYPYQTCTEVCP